MIELGVVVKVTSVSLSAAKYMGIVQDHLKLQIDQLAGCELEAGVRALQQAADSQGEQTSLLREARARFNKAISLEKDFRLAAAFLGLALCHSGLGDAVNAEKALSGLANVPPPEIPTILTAGRVLNNAPWWTTLALWPLAGVKAIGAPVADAMLVKLEQAIVNLTSLQQDANGLLEQSLREGCESVFGLTNHKK